MFISPAVTMPQLTSRLVQVCRDLNTMGKTPLTNGFKLDDVKDIFRRITGSELVVENLKVQQLVEEDE